MSNTRTMFEEAISRNTRLNSHFSTPIPIFSTPALLTRLHMADLCLRLVLCLVLGSASASAQSTTESILLHAPYSMTVNENAELALTAVSMSGTAHAHAPHRGQR